MYDDILQLSRRRTYAHGAVAYHGIALDVPVVDILQSDLEQIGDLIRSEIRFKRAFQRSHDRRIVEQDRRAHMLHSLDDGREDAQMVRAAGKVSRAEGMTFARVHKRLISVEHEAALVEMHGADTADGVKCDRVFHRDAAKRFDKLFKAREIDLDIVVDIDAVELFESGYGNVNAPDAAVSQLVAAVQVRIANEEITRRRICLVFVLTSIRILTSLCVLDTPSSHLSTPLMKNTSVSFSP